MSPNLKVAKTWGVSFVACTGAASGIVALIPATSLSAWIYGGMMGLCVILSSVVAWRQRKLADFPADIILPPSEKVACRLECPATRPLLEAASALARHSFGNVGSVSPDRYDSWWLKNHNILACLLNTDHKLVGYFDVLPLRSNFMDAFIRGDVTELDIRHEDILPPGQARKCKRLYIAGIAVRDSQTFAGKRYAAHLIWALARYLDHFYDVPSERQVYALGATDGGRRLVEHLGFRLIQDGSGRRDGQQLYVASLSEPEIIQRIDSELGNWAHACKLSWDEEKPRALTRKSVS